MLESLLNDFLDQKHRLKLVADANVAEFYDAELQRFTLLPLLRQQIVVHGKFSLDVSGSSDSRVL